MISWKKCAEYDLRDYRAQKEAIKNLSEKIRHLDDRLTSIRSSMKDEAAVHGGAFSYEDTLLNVIVEKMRLEEAKRETVQLVEMIERGLSALSEEQQKVLKMFFMGGGGYRRAMVELHVEKDTAYRRRDEALRIFTIVMYGVTEL